MRYNKTIQHSDYGSFLIQLINHTDKQWRVIERGKDKCGYYALLSR